jgi:outer membrane receptor for ferrienterochelin and colicins
MTITKKNAVITVETSLFYTYFSNKIIGDFQTDPQKIIFDNLKGHAVSEGVSLNLDFLFSNGFKLITGGTYMDVYSVEPDSNGSEVRTPQLHAPAFSGNLTASYTFGNTGICIDYTMNIKSPMHLPVVKNDYRPEQSPWFSIHNFQLSKKFGNGFEVYAGIKNAFDFVPADPILRPFDPFDKYIDENNPNGYTFDPSYNYSSIQGRRFFAGIRYNLKGN